MIMNNIATFNNNNHRTNHIKIHEENFVVTTSFIQMKSAEFFMLSYIL